MKTGTTTATGVATSADSLKSRFRLDCLSEIFIRMTGYVNVNTNQIFVVDGTIDRAALERSVARAIGSIPLLRSRPHEAIGTMEISSAAPGTLVWHRTFGGKCDLTDPAFRDLLMDFSHSMRIDWRMRSPIQVLLVSGLHGATSCIYLSTHHGVADARSDCLLLQTIMHYYAEEMGLPLEKKTLTELPYDCLPRISPHWYSPLGKAKRWLHALVSIAVDAINSDRGMAVPYQKSRWEATSRNPGIARLDFFHSVMPKETEKKLKRAAQAAGVTINSVLFGALVRTIEKANPPQGGKIRVTCAISLRRLIDPSYDHTFRNYLIASNIRVDTGLPAQRLVSHVQRSVQRARSERGILSALGRVELLLPYFRIRALTARIALPMLNRVQGTNACYSNPGVIEENFSYFGIPKHKTLQYTGFGCLVPPYDFILYTPTVNGRMQIDLVYRRTCFPNIQTSFVHIFNAALDHLLDELLPKTIEEQTISHPSFEMDPS